MFMGLRVPLSSTSSIMSTALSSSTVVRHKPAVLAVIGAATVAVVWMCFHDGFGGLFGDAEPIQEWSDRSSTSPIHERRRSGGNGTLPAIEEILHGQARDVTMDDAATDVGFDPARQAEDGDHLRQLGFAIAEDRAQKEGIVHRGVACDSCGTRPIRGIRFRCANCPDFDLCMDCESREKHGHPRTHVFFKIRVPAPWAAKQPLPIWYPGTLWRLNPDLEMKTKGQLMKESEFSLEQIDGYYTQFSCLANAKYPADPLHLGMAIDEAGFYQCFLPALGRWRLTKPNLIFERLFKFYDQNDDGLISFDEFIAGNRLVHSMNKEARSKRIFQGLDLNDDGYISRDDFQRVFLDYFEINKDIVVSNYLAEARGENDAEIRNEVAQNDFINGGKSLSSYFLLGNEQFADEFMPNPRRSEGKQSDFGDVMPGYSTVMSDSKFYRQLNFEQDSKLVGGTEATNYIYDIIQAAINELVNPLFEDSEAVVSEILETAEDRAKYKHGFRRGVTGDVAKLRAAAMRALETETRDEPSDTRLKYLNRLECAHTEIQIRGGPGRINCEEFIKILKRQEDSGSALLQWVGSWVDLVMF